MANEVQTLKDSAGNAYPIKDATARDGLSAVNSNSGMIETLTGLKYQKIGKEVKITAVGISLSNLITGWNTIFTLPTGFHPLSEYDFTGMSGNNTTNPTSIRIRDDGSVLVFSKSTTLPYLRFYGSFYIV